MGTRLWEKLQGHYFNYIDHDISHDFKINFEKRYRILEKAKEKVTDDFSIRSLKNSVISFVSQGKNENEASLLSQIRNLENIVFCDPEEVAKCNTTLELQVLIDSAVPVVNAESAQSYVDKLQKNLYKWKLTVENGKYFESEKERLLGLPFMMKRHRQYPEPAIGTWQYNLFEEIFGHSYSYGKDDIENEEKINKFNYKQFLHPSIIEKFNDDPNHPDFEMYIKMKNIETQTKLEKAKEERKLFCTKILPTLNLLRDENKGRDFAHHYVNFQSNKSELAKHYNENYSNKQEEYLFRVAEEARLVDKNSSIVSEVISPSINKEYRGIRGKELRDILNNPKKKSEVTKALKTKYKFYSPQNKFEHLKSERNRIGLIDTAIEEGINLNDPEQNNYQSLFDKTFSKPDQNEAEDASLSKKNGDESLNTYPLGHPEAIFFRYDDRISFEDYVQDVPESGYASFKNMRYEYRTKEEQEKYIREYTRKFGNPAFKEQEGFLVPHLERGNDEAEEKIFKKVPATIFEQRKNIYSNELTEIQDFVDFKVEQDTSAPSDLTEDDLDQAIFEAQFKKSVDENEEFRRMEKRSRDELLALFKVNNLTPHELWSHVKAKRNQKPNRIVYEAAQINDPLYHLYSEAEIPEAFRKVLKKWRKGAEIRTKLPYYPETKKPEKYFELI